MSTRQLAYYFACLEYSREQILEQYLLYTSDAFIDLVRHFPEYETALKKHCEKFSKYSFRKKFVEWFKGNYKYGLAKHFKKLCDRLPKKEVPQESVPVKPKSLPKKADLSLAREWIQLASEWTQSLHLYKQYAPESAQRFKNRIEAFVDRSLVNDQSAIQRILIQESDDLITIIETDTNQLIREHVGSLRQCVTAAREFTQLKEIKTAAVILDFCWSFTELAETLVRDAAQVVVNVANNVLEHPVELAIVVAAPLLPPPILCAYHAYRAYQLICYLAPKIKDVAGIAMTALQDPIQGLDDAKTYIRPLTNFVEKIQNKEITLTQCIEYGAIAVAQFYVERKLHGGLSGLCGSIKDKAITWITKNPSLKSAHYLKTPEGLILKVVQGAQDGSLKERVTQTLNRTEEFFKETEFGIKHAKDFQWSIYGYRPHRAFKAITNINGEIKKGYYIVLDGLHKNHLELYDKGKKWLKVINFDGTYNAHLTEKVKEKRYKLHEM